MECRAQLLKAQTEHIPNVNIVETRLEDLNNWEHFEAFHDELGLFMTPGSLTCLVTSKVARIGWHPTGKRRQLKRQAFGKRVNLRETTLAKEYWNDWVVPEEGDILEAIKGFIMKYQEAGVDLPTLPQLERRDDFSFSSSSETTEDSDESVS